MISRFHVCFSKHIQHSRRTFDLSHDRRLAWSSFFFFQHYGFYGL